MNPISAAILLVASAASLTAQQALLASAAGQAQGVPLAKAWPEALRVAKLHKAPILAFVVPPAGARTDVGTVSRTLDLERQLGVLSFESRSLPPMRTKREVLLRHVQLLRLPQWSVHRILLPTRQQAVFAVTVPVFANAADCGAEADETVVLCGPDGKRQHGWKLDLLDSMKFDELVGGQVLAAQALQARRADVAPDLSSDLAALRRLDAAIAAGDALPAAAQQRLGEEHQCLSAKLRDAWPGIAPVLVEETEDGKQRLAPELAAFESQQLPLGVTSRVIEGDPCLGCGMGYVPPQLRTVLELIGP